MKKRVPFSDRRAGGGRRGAARGDHSRQLVAQEAARIMVERGISDFGIAKRKAAERLGLDDRASLPRNTEIEQAIVEYQRLFAGSEYDALLGSLRRTARRAMRLFEAFEPRLVGTVLSGAVSAHSDVNLHLFADTPEHVAIHLIGAEIPYETSERRVRVTRDRYDTVPVYRFAGRDVQIDAMVFPTDGLRQAPLCAVDGRPLKRARIDELDALIESTTQG